MLPFQSLSPISAIVANGGEVLEGCMELDFCTLVYFWFILKYLPSLPLHSLLGFIYIVETPPSVMVDNICNEFMFIHTCINYGGVCSIYVDGLTSHTFVVFDVSATILVR